MRNAFFVAAVLTTLASASTASAAAFTHTVNPAAVVNNYSRIDHPSLNGNPNAIVLAQVTSSTFRGNVGVFYDTGASKWAVFREDRANLGAASFNIVVDGGFRHRSTPANINSNWTYLDTPETNANPFAVVFVTQGYNPSGANLGYNDHPVGVWYDQSVRKWAVYNEDRAAMGVGLDFYVKVFRAASTASRPAVFEFVAASASAPLPSQAGDANTVVLLTHSYGTDARAAYLATPWAIVPTANRSGWQLAGVPAVPANTRFNVIAYRSN